MFTVAHSITLALAMTGYIELPARVVEPLRQMGAKIETAEGGKPPLQIHGGQSLHAIQYAMPMASAQVKSCLLLAGIFANGTAGIARERDEAAAQRRAEPVDRSLTSEDNRERLNLPPRLRRYRSAGLIPRPLRSCRCKYLFQRQPGHTVNGAPDIVQDSHHHQG